MSIYETSITNPKKQLEFYKQLSEQLQQENEQLKIQISARETAYNNLENNWKELKEYISVKLYNTEYLQKLCGCRIDDINHILLDAIKEEIQELGGSDSDE